MKQEILGLGKDSLTFGVGSAITRVVGLLTLPLFTVYLTPSEYGVIAMLALLSMVLQPIFSFGLGAAMGLYYFKRDDPENKSMVVWTVFLIHALSSLFLMIIGWTCSTFIAKLLQLSAEYDLAVSLSLTGSAFTIMVTSLMARVQFEKKAKLYVVITMATLLTAVSVSIFTVIYLGWGVVGMVLGQVSGNAITLLTFFVIALRNTRMVVSGAMAKELISKGLPLIPSFAFVFIITHGNKYILEWSSGLEAVGIYSIGFNLGMTISIVTSGIATAWFPFFMSYVDRQKEIEEVFAKIFTYYVFGVGFLSILYFVFAKLVVLLITHEAYHSAHHLIGFIATACLFQTLFVFFLPGLYFNGEVKYVSVVQGMAALLSLPLNFYLITELGILGAALGMMLSSLLMAILMQGWNIINRSRYPSINYEWSKVFRFLAIACAVYAAVVSIEVISIISEIVKAILITAAAMVATFLLLEKKEQHFLLNKRVLHPRL